MHELFRGLSLAQRDIHHYVERNYKRLRESYTGKRDEQGWPLFNMRTPRGKTLFRRLLRRCFPISTVAVPEVLTALRYRCAHLQQKLQALSADERTCRNAARANATKASPSATISSTFKNQFFNWLSHCFSAQASSNVSMQSTLNVFISDSILRRR